MAESRQAANEASALSSVRTLGTAQATYQSTRGLGVNFAISLADLAYEGSIDSTLATGTKSGYRFISIGHPATQSDPSFFDTEAMPIPNGLLTSGDRSFYSNETYVIFQRSGRFTDSWGAIFPKRIPDAPATALQ